MDLNGFEKPTSIPEERNQTLSRIASKQKFQTSHNKHDFISFNALR